MKSWTLILPVATLGSLAMLPLAAQAQDSVQQNPGIYLGGSAIYTNIENEFVDQDFPNDDDDFDDDRVSWKAFAGFRFNPVLAVEGQYIDFGNSKKGAAEADADGWTAALVASIPLQYVQPYAKAGALFWNVDAKFDNPIGSDPKYSDDGTDFFWGLGVRFALTDNLALRAEYERFELESSNLKTDVDAASLGLQFSF